MSQGVVFAQGSVDDTRVYSKVADAGELGLLSVSHAAMGTPPSSLAPARQQGGCTTVPARLAGWWLGDGNPNDTVGGKHGILENGATYAGGIVGRISLSTVWTISTPLNIDQSDTSPGLTMAA